MNRYQKDTATIRVECSRFEVELQAVETLINKPAKIDSTGKHEVLLDRADTVIGILQVVEARNVTGQPTRGTSEQRALQSPSIASRQQITVRVRRAIQLVEGDRSCSCICSVGRLHSASKVLQVCKCCGKKPGTEAFFLTHQGRGKPFPYHDTSPHQRFACSTRPYRDNTRRLVP